MMLDDNVCDVVDDDFIFIDGGASVRWLLVLCVELE